MFDDFNRTLGEYKAAILACQHHPSQATLCIVNDLLADVLEEAIEVRKVAAKEVELKEWVASEIGTGKPV